MRPLRRIPPPIGGLLDINPHGSFSTTVVNGTIPDETVAVDGQDRIWLETGSYTGGRRAWGLWDGSSLGIRGLLSSWEFDWEPNMDGVNSSPWPNYAIQLTTYTDVADVQSPGNEVDRSIFAVEIGNGYSCAIRVYGTTGAQVYTTSNSAYAYAGVAMRVSFDYPTDTITWWGNTSGDFGALVNLGSYTFTATDRSNMQYENSRFGISVGGRGTGDGWRNINWRQV